MPLILTLEISRVLLQDSLAEKLQEALAAA